VWRKTIYTRKRKYLTTEENMKIVKKRNGTSHLFEGSDDEIYAKWEVLTHV
jgi:hypothetical protein